jgi:small subunit ribosomal protein S4
MGRYTGPVERLSRREGVELFLKGERLLAGKSGLERRGPNPPGDHGGARRRGRESIYSIQLREKQRAKRYYGVREKQFRRYVEKATRSQGRVGDALLIALERRLDNVVYRAGLASTRAQARQFVGHQHVHVDGQRVDIASFLVKPGQVVALKPESPVKPAAVAATEMTSSVPSWLEADFDALSVKVLRLPERREIAVPVDEQLIVEFYARR